MVFKDRHWEQRNWESKYLLKTNTYSFIDSFNKYLSGYHMPGTNPGLGRSVIHSMEKWDSICTNSFYTPLQQHQLLCEMHSWETAYYDSWHSSGQCSWNSSVLFRTKGYDHPLSEPQSVCSTPFRLDVERMVVGTLWMRVFSILARKWKLLY